jgi:hypothetical protein
MSVKSFKSNYRCKIKVQLHVKREIKTYENSLLHEKDTGVGFKVNTRCPLDNLETLDSNISLVRETEADKVKHLGWLMNLWGDFVADRKKL